MGTVALATLHAALLHLALRRVLVLVLVRMWMWVGMWVGMLLLTLLIAHTLRMLTILAAHICNLCEVDLKLSCRHYLEVTHDRFILGVLVVELVALGTHIACYVENLLAHICTVLRLNDMTHKALRMLTIVLEHDTALRIWQLFGLQLKVLA